MAREQGQSKKNHGMNIYWLVHVVIVLLSHETYRCLVNLLGKKARQQYKD